MKKRWKIFAKILALILAIWIVMTFWVQYTADHHLERFDVQDSVHQALIVFNPDPIYDLDAQVCESFARGLQSVGISTVVASIKACSDLEIEPDLLVFCANTYNWAPDWQLTKHIKSHRKLDGKQTVALTVGSGSTARAKSKLEWHLMDRGAFIAGSEVYWLLRPNDENRMKEKNIAVARDKAQLFGKEIGLLISRAND